MRFGGGLRRRLVKRVAGGQEKEEGKPIVRHDLSKTSRFGVQATRTAGGR